jgi:hypothetical protein
MNRQRLRHFIAHHDESWLFVAIYIGLAVVLSILLSLFWLVAVAGLHFLLECARHAPHRDGPADTAAHALWEIKLDVTLVLIALALALYMDVVLGVLGLQSAARVTAASRIGMRAARFAAWQRVIRGAVLVADDVFVVGARVLRRGQSAEPDMSAVAAVSDLSGMSAGSGADARGGASAQAVPPPAVVQGTGSAAVAAEPAAHGLGTWRQRWSFGDRLTLAVLGCSVAIILFAPVMTEHSWSGAVATLLHELQPFPSR